MIREFCESHVPVSSSLVCASRKFLSESAGTSKVPWHPPHDLAAIPLSREMRTIRRDAYGLQSPATCATATLRRFQTLMLAIARIAISVLMEPARLRPLDLVILTE